MERIQEAKILIVDDNVQLVDLITAILKKEGYLSIDAAKTCKEALDKFNQNLFDFVILDVNLPDGNGFDLLKTMRRKEDIPILFLSARDEDQDRLFGLGLGADDYLTKPFLTQELLLRISLILKRTYRFLLEKKEDSIYYIGDTKIDFASGSIQKASQTDTMTAKEMLLLKKMIANRGNIVTFDTLCEAVWGDGYYGYENTLMVHMRHLREKIEKNPSKPQYIQTVRGLGYKLAKELW